MFSGKFVVRLGSDLHRQLSHYAKKNSLSLNQLCVQFLQKGLENQTTAPAWRDVALPLIEPLRLHFGDKLVGVVAFGSQVQGTATSQSDLDLLVVLEATVNIKRKLYTWWDTTIRWSGPIQTVNPHFVHMPENVSETGGLWLEVALCHNVLFDQGMRVSAGLSSLLEEIRRGQRIRLFSNGHPYWVREAS